MEILKNVIAAMEALWDPIFWFANVAGFFLVIVSIFTFVSYKGQWSQGDAGWGMIAGFVAGICLLNLTWVLDIVSGTVLMTESQNSLMDMSGGGGVGEYTSTMVQFGIYSVMIVGLVGVVSGLLGMRMAAKQAQSGIGPDLIKIVGGTLAVNVAEVVNILAVTAGGAVQEGVNKVMGLG